MLSAIFKSRYLPPSLQRELADKNESEIRELLPVLGPLLGVGVLLFSIWDFFIDPTNALHAYIARLAFVMIGMAACKPDFLQWSPTLRCHVLYWSYSCAVIVSASLLDEGIIYGLPGITACIFTLTVLTVRFDTLLFVATPPFVLFAGVSSVKLPITAFINSIGLYIMSVALACVLLFVIRFFRRKELLLEHELMHLARHDSLTGLYNRGYLIELANHEVALAKRHERPFAVLMVDIDYFKKVNDTYGHDAGDRVLKAVADASSRCLREIDHIGRFGGEEFVCILPETTERDALICAERLRKSIEQLRIVTPKAEIGLTASIGVAVSSPAHADWEAVLGDADVALYRAKDEGRNCVVLAEMPGSPGPGMLLLSGR
jgi:diguanylate cyclase (GGDEF)-like protein